MVDLIYLDFGKTFDEVNHGIVCDKVRSLGIKWKLGESVHDFLQNRSQIVIPVGAQSARK